MFSKLIPKDDFYFDTFDKVAANIVNGVSLFKKMIEDKKNSERYAMELKEVEHSTDNLVHQAINHMHSTFITPLDREDIHTLLGRLDDIIDLTDVAASNIQHYKPKTVPPELKDLVKVLHESTVHTQEMVGLLRSISKNSGRIKEISVEINRLENEADAIRRATMARLFKNEKNPVELIKWKDILNCLENATDKCEDVSDIIQGIVLENT